MGYLIGVLLGGAFIASTYALVVSTRGQIARFHELVSEEDRA